MEGVVGAERWRTVDGVEEEETRTRMLQVEGVEVGVRRRWWAGRREGWKGECGREWWEGGEMVGSGAGERPKAKVCIIGERLVGTWGQTAAAEQTRRWWYVFRGGRRIT